MNIDDLKNTWNEDIVHDIPEINTEQKRKINLPLEKMRRNMRKEFWSTVIMFVLVFPLIWMVVPEAPFKFKFYITVLVASMMMVTVFFFSKFFILYKEMGNPMLKTYDALKDLLQQLNLNKQYYLSFYLSFVPFLVCEMIIIIEFLPRPKPIGELQTALFLIGSVTIGLFMLYFVGSLWFKKLYGKHIQQIEKLILEFGG